MAHKWIREGLRLADAVRKFGHPIALARRYGYLYRDRRFSPNEIRLFRLLDPTLDRASLARFVSKEELLEVQRSLNPPSLHVWTEDKLEFHLRCVREGLRVPRLVGALSPRRYDGLSVPVAQSARELVELLGASEDRTLILKPVAGVHGDGVTRLVRSPDGWIDASGAPFTVARFERMVTTSGYEAWMLQEELVGHPALHEFSDTSGLQTCRIVTFLADAGDVEILAARLRLICGDSARDNFSYGTTGNVIANLDPGTGRIVSAVTGTGRDPEIVSVAVHPRTKRELVGFAVPDWPSATALALRAARAFAPLRTIGWDVAITPDGACLIEGNVTWDTLSGDPRMGEIHRRLAAECRRSGAQTEEPEARRTPIPDDDAVQQNQ